MKNVSPQIVLCNGADPPQPLDQSKLLSLSIKNLQAAAQMSNLPCPILFVVCLIFLIVS